MKIIGLMPVRNEAWVLPHSLACLSGFCDVVLVSDQNSEDKSREICRQFPKVVLLESSEDLVCEQARWQLWDVARDYDGYNLLWCSDADEVLSPRLANRFFERQRALLRPATAVEVLFYHLWGRVDRYRDDSSPYRPHWKPMAIVDDRQTNYDRSLRLPLHQPRVAVREGGPVLQATEVPVFHLQWLIANRNQMKQAWYRCRELLSGEKRAVEINAKYSATLPAARVHTTRVPPQWVEDLTFPDMSIDSEPSWQERDILGWFEQHGPERFELLEIWHNTTLREEFRRRVGRRPKADRSYVPSWPTRAQNFARRTVSAARRRMPLLNG